MEHLTFESRGIFQLRDWRIAIPRAVTKMMKILLQKESRDQITMNAVVNEHDNDGTLHSINKVFWENHF